LVDASFDYIKHNFADVDFIVYTGDVPRHYFDKQIPLNPQDVIDAHIKLVKYFQSAVDLNRVKVIPTLGNHDVYVTDKMSDEYPNPLLDSLVKIWQPYRLNLGDSFRRFGSFVQPVSPGLSVVSLNTLHWFVENPLAKDCDGKSIGSAQLTWLEGVLKTAKQNSQRVYLMGHVPPIDETTKKVYLPQCLKEYVNLSGKYADVIVSQFHGHTDCDIFSFVVQSAGKTDYDLITVTKKSPPQFAAGNAQKVVGVLNNGPSIIPDNNPAMRVYDYSPKDGQILDYTQYYTDLNKANAEGKVQWQVEYKFKDTYNVNNWSLSDWSKVLQNLSSGGQMWNDYVRRVTVQT